MEDQNKQFNEQEYEWYDLEDSGEKAAEKRSIPIAKILIIVFIVIAFIAAIFGVYKTIKYFYSVEEEVVENTSLLMEQCKKEQDVEKCMANVGPRLAQQTGNVDYCKELNSDARDSCIVMAALTSLDIEVCRMVDNKEVENQCSDAVLTETIDNSSSYDECSRYSNIEHQKMCEIRWERNAIIYGDCDYDQISDLLCATGEIIKQAIELQDPDVCGSIGLEDYQEYCFELVSPGDRDFDNVNSDEEEYQGTSDLNADSDGDGLNDYDDIYNYGTSPISSDTDGDGYDDNTEIIGGYDPLR